MEDQHRIFIEEALALAMQSVHSGGGPFGAVVVKDGVIVGRGMNRVTLAHDPTAHGEVMAIRDACARLGTFQLTGCTIYSSSEPCPMCAAAIYWARPSAIYYASPKSDAAAVGFDDTFIGVELAKDPSQRTIPMRQIVHEDAQAALQQWQSAKDRIDY